MKVSSLVRFFQFVGIEIGCIAADVGGSYRIILATNDPTTNSNILVLEVRSVFMILSILRVELEVLKSPKSFEIP